MKASTNRSLLYGLVGGYLLYIAYELLQNRINNVATTMPLWLSIVFMILFAGIGVTLLVFAWRIWKQGRVDQDESPVSLEESEGKPGYSGEKEPDESKK